ncbi:MAG: peroxiredoxin [Phycisphaerales bacterium]|nr:peroxiredoxin [Phycisphaerales bacterium]
MPPIEVGQLAPEFALKDQSGKTRSLSDYRGRIVVIYFYPEDDTPLCTTQACQFRDHHPDFVKVKAAILGVSPQDVESHLAFARHHALPFPLLADVPDASGSPGMCVRYGVWREKNMYGKKVVGMVRTTYLIDAQGRVARRWDSVKTPRHSETVLAAALALHRGERLTVMGKPKAIKRDRHPRQKTRTQGGHRGYSGVPTSKGKKTRQKAIGEHERSQTRRRSAGVK